MINFIPLFSSRVNNLLKQNRNHLQISEQNHTKNQSNENGVKCLEHSGKSQISIKYVFNSDMLFD